jgi:phosphoribosylformimino-5-aminoimidazole carboxamide ribotide isomerase
MLIIPAIDIINGKSVRLYKGDYQQSTVYGKNPLEQAQEFYDLGFTRIHMVDLLAAKEGKSKELQWVEKIKNRIDIVIDFGGGIRSQTQIQSLLSAGVDKINISSMAVKQVELTKTMIELFGSNRFVLCPDSKNGIVQTHGWLSESSLTVYDFIRQYSRYQALEFLCTDVNQDGTLKGLNMSLYKNIKNRFPDLQIIASGGLASIKDIEACQKNNCFAVILGKAWYEKKIVYNEIKNYLGKIC